MAHSAGHFDAVFNDTEKMVFNLNAEQLYDDQVFQNLDAEFHRRTRDQKETTDRIDQLVAELSELNGKILVASDSKAESETSLQEADSDIASVTASRRATLRGVGPRARRLWCHCGFCSLSMISSWRWRPSTDNQAEFNVQLKVSTTLKSD